MKNYNKIINIVEKYHYSVILDKMIKMNIFNKNLNNFILISKRFLLIKQILNIKDIDINLVNEFGNTSLHISVSRHDYKITELLLDYGINPNIKNCINSTALDIANGRNDIHIADLILSHKSGQRLKKLDLLKE